MGRITGVEKREAPFSIRLIYRFVERELGKVVAPAKIMAHCPSILWGMGFLDRGIQRSRRLDARLKDLVNVKVAKLIGCPF